MECGLGFFFFVHDGWRELQWPCLMGRNAGRGGSGGGRVKRSSRGQSETSRRLKEGRRGRAEG